MRAAPVSPTPTTRSGPAPAIRRAALALTGVVALAAVACTASGASPADHTGPGGVTTTAVVTGAALAAAPAPSAPAPAPSTTTSSSTTTTAKPRPLDDGQLTPGEQGPEVALLQLRLAELGYRPGALDGGYGPAVSSAVMAFQKREGLSRDGTAGPEVLARLRAPQGAGPQDASGGPRIEVDLDRQIAFVIIGGVVTTINVSTGNGETYHVPDSDRTAVAYTPTGSYRVGLRIDGPEHGKLGVLYRPLYFTGGWAVHGSTSVPAYPASHGCVRTSYADQDWLFDQFPSGSSVVITKGGSAASSATPDGAAGGE